MLGQLLVEWVVHEDYAVRGHDEVGTGAKQEMLQGFGVEQAQTAVRVFFPEEGLAPELFGAELHQLE